MAFILQTTLLASLVAARHVPAVSSSRQSSGLLHPRTNDVNHDDSFQLVAYCNTLPPFMTSKLNSLSFTEVNGEKVVVLSGTDGQTPRGEHFYMNSDINQRSNKARAIVTDGQSEGFVVSTEADRAGRYPVKVVPGPGTPAFDLYDPEGDEDDWVPLRYNGIAVFFFACRTVSDDRKNILQLFYGADGTHPATCAPVRLFPLCAGDFDKSTKNNRPSLVQAACYPSMKKLIEHGGGGPTDD